MYIMQAFFKHSQSMTTTNSADKAFAWVREIKANGGKELLAVVLYGPGEQAKHPAIAPQGALMQCLHAWAKPA